MYIAKIIKISFISLLLTVVSLWVFLSPKPIFAQCSAPYSDLPWGGTTYCVRVPPPPCDTSTETPWNPVGLNYCVLNSGAPPPSGPTPTPFCNNFTDCLQNTSVSGLSGFTNPGNMVTELVNLVFPLILGIAGFAAVILIIVSGIQFVTSSGNPEAAGAARGRLIFSLIGFGLIILAFAILQIVDYLFLGSNIV